MTVAHATVPDLTAWMGDDQDVPTNAERLLNRASEVVDETVIVPYLVDDAGVPIDSQVVDALRDATCAQVEWWATVGEDVDVEGQVESARIGNVQLSYGSGGSRVAPATVATRTLRVLRIAGLLYRGALVR